LPFQRFRIRKTAAPGSASKPGWYISVKKVGRLAGREVHPLTCAFLRAKYRFFMRDVAARHRYHALAFCHLNLEIHHILLSELISEAAK
jgi:hypothetical protein